MGQSNLRFADGELYTWRKVKTTVYNIIAGKMYLDHTGTMRVLNETTAALCKLRFKDHGMLSGSEKHQVVGHLEQAAGGVVGEISGAWDSHLYQADSRLGTPQRTLWRRYPPLAGPRIEAEVYNWSAFSVGLNQLHPELAPLLPPTDSRLRPDQRMLARRVLGF